MSGDVVLAAKGLTKSFGATRALRGADVEVEGGEVLAVMGPSGSGKSTLLHCLAGILRPRRRGGVVRRTAHRRARRAGQDDVAP